MFNFDKADVQRVAISVIGAFILSTTMVVSAVGPARAIETTPVVQAAPVGQASA